MNDRAPSRRKAPVRGEVLLIVISFALAFLAAPRVHAQTSAVPAASDAAAPATVAATDAATDAAAVARDPFWPMGYRPKPKEEPKAPGAAAEAAAPVAEPEIRWPDLRLRGLVKNSKGGFLAVIDPFGLVEPGQVLELEQGELLYRWKVSNITGKGASCSRLDVRRAK